MVTITDIAEKAQVSPATVSRVLNGKVAVSEEKRRLVNHWIVTLGYKPNHVAQTLVGKKSFLLGMVITDVSNPFFSEMVRVIQQLAFQRGYAIVLCNTAMQSDAERQQVCSLLRRKVDGVLIVPSDPEAQSMRALKTASVPTVVITQQHADFDSISVDHQQGGAIAASHLLSSGNTELAYFGNPHDEKYIGFRKEALSRGLPAEAIHCMDVKYESFDRSAVDQQIRAFFSSEVGRRVSGIFALNDFIAMAVINAAEDAGFSVPRDVSVVGFDNTYLAMMHRPAVTSVSQPIEEMGTRAIECLYRRIEGESGPPEAIQLHPTVVVRESSTREVKE